MITMMKTTPLLASLWFVFFFGGGVVRERTMQGCTPCTLPQGSHTTYEVGLLKSKQSNVTPLGRQSESHSIDSAGGKRGCERKLNSPQLQVSKRPFLKGMKATTRQWNCKISYAYWIYDWYTVRYWQDWQMKRPGNFNISHRFQILHTFVPTSSCSPFSKILCRKTPWDGSHGHTAVQGVRGAHCKRHTATKHLVSVRGRQDNQGKPTTNGKEALDDGIPPKTRIKYNHR